MAEIRGDIIQSAGSGRLAQLDGLRGIAAFSVFLFHCGLIPGFWNKSLSLPGILGDGGAAVDLFFVLSGFVLARSLMGKKKSGYFQFVIRRAMRIYPAYWTTLLLCAALISMYDASRNPFFDELIRSFWSQPVGWAQWLLHALLILPGVDRGRVDGVMWSLVIEMRISLLLPMFLSIYLLLSAPGRAILLLVSPALLMLGQTAAFVPLFLMGIALASYLNKQEIFTPRFTIPVAFGLGLLLYGNREIFELPGGSIGGSVADIVSGLGSALIILAAIGSKRLSRFLTSRPIQFLGDVSYSFYLIHWPILLFLTSRMFGAGYPPMACAAVSLIAAWIVAYLSYRFVELPGMNIGKIIATRIAAPSQVKAI